MVLPGGRWEGELCAPVSHKGATKAQGLLQVSLTWKQLKFWSVHQWTCLWKEERVLTEKPPEQVEEVTAVGKCR